MKQCAMTIVAVLVLSGGQTAWAHADDFEVGINPATNQILVEFDPDIFTWLLPPSGDPMLLGFALDDPGFVSLEANEALPGVFEPLSSSADIQMQVLAVSSPEIKVWNPLGPGETGFQITGARRWNIGAPFFDTHPWWHIDTTDPSYAPSHGPWSVTFQIVDSASVYLAADPLTVTFTPEPATFAITSLLLLVVGRRRIVS